MNIKSIVCPFCKDVYLYLYKELLIQDKRPPMVVSMEFRCPKCPIVHQYDWFDTFKQFEKFVTRFDEC